MRTLAHITQSSILRWASHVARMEEGRSAFKIVTDTPSGKRSSGRPRRKWENNIRMELKEIVSSQYEDLGWFGSG